MMLLTIGFCAEITGKWTGCVKYRFGCGYKNFVVAGYCQELRGGSAEDSVLNTPASCSNRDQDSTDHFKIEAITQS
jgi:hypothetical protein